MQKINGGGEPGTFWSHVGCIRGHANEFVVRVARTYFHGHGFESLVGVTDASVHRLRLCTNETSSMSNSSVH